MPNTHIDETSSNYEINHNGIINNNDNTEKSEDIIENQNREDIIKTRKDIEDIQETISDLIQSISNIDSGVQVKWYENIKVNSDIINNRNIIELPNKKIFSDLNSESILVFVNDKYIAPDNYKILTKTSFFFKYNNIIKSGDIVHIIQFDKNNILSNHDTNELAIAKVWQYEYKNETDSPINIIELNNQISFSNSDKGSLLVYIDNKFINTTLYEVPNRRQLLLNEPLYLNSQQIITIIQLAEIVPSEEYIGYVWRESINILEDTNNIIISKNHAFTNTHDENSLLVFVNDCIRKDYTVLSTSEIQFDNIIEANSIVEIIQLGYITDIRKIKDSMDIETIKNLLNIDSNNYVKEISRNKLKGFAGINEQGFIDSNVIDIDVLANKIKQKFVDYGWLPNSGVNTNHIHSNLDVLYRLQLYKGKLYCDGYRVGEKAKERSIDITLNESMINNCGFELPTDCDPNRPITLIINSIPALHDNDWILILNDYPELDKISWKNKYPQEVLEIGDLCTVTYYSVEEDMIDPPLPPSDSGYAHYHNNMTLLESLSVNNLHQLCINDIPVSEESVEIDQDYIITDENIHNKYIELPYDCDGTRPIVFTIANVVMMHGIDYKVILNEYPIKDRISWENMNLDNLIMTGDNICITYYKKMLNN